MLSRSTPTATGRWTSWGSSREPSCAASRPRSCATTQRSTPSPRPCGPAATCRHRSTALIGRRAEIDGATTLLRGGARLVTLTGPGGVGKTRVALAAAHELAGTFADGVWFVGLAALVDPVLVRPAVASALELPEESLLDELHTRELLLLLDNFEQVLEAAPFVTEVLQAAPRVRVLTTSRAPLRVYGEHERTVPPLAAEEAEELYVVRARAADSEADPRLTAEICERLDRLPLAIELVAARTGELTSDELLASLDRRLEVGSRGARDVPERQRTLRAAIGWSYDLLRPVEQTSVRRPRHVRRRLHARRRRGRLPARRSAAGAPRRAVSSGEQTTGATGCSRRFASTPSNGSRLPVSQASSAGGTPSTSPASANGLSASSPVRRSTRPMRPSSGSTTTSAPP